MEFILCVMGLEPRAGTKIMYVFSIICQFNCIYRERIMTVFIIMYLLLGMEVVMEQSWRREGGVNG